jgi:uroporphyrinogen III methyltransferase/synthase
LNVLPLQGLRIAVTRPRGQAGSLIEGLERLGAEAIHCPTIRIVEDEVAPGLRRAIGELESFDWIVFTSANGVRVFWKALRAVRARAALPARLRVAAIGPATGRALGEHGVNPTLIPDEYVAEAVADALTGVDDLTGRRVLLPRAAGARKALPERLQTAGARVDEVAVYESLPDEEGIERLRGAVERGGVDMITFTSASTVRCFVDAAGPDVGEARIAAIGPITAAVARELGMLVDVEAEEYTVEGLLRAISQFYGEGGDES